MKFTSKCKKTTHICDRNQYKEIGFLERITMTFHFLLCKGCREYSKRNGKLTKTIETAQIKTLLPEQKQALKNRLSQEIKKTSNL